MLVDPASAVKRMAIYNKIAQPAKVTDVKQLAQALENWLSDKNEYEKMEDEAGTPCRLSADAGLSAMYALLPSTLEDTVIFQKEAFSRWEDMFDRMASFGSSKQSLGQVQRSTGGSPMDLDAFGKGRPKGACFICGQTTHYARNCPQKGKGYGGNPRGKGPEGKVEARASYPHGKGAERRDGKGYGGKSPGKAKGKDGKKGGKFGGGKAGK